MDHMTLVLLASIVFLSGVSLTWWCEKRYDLAIFLVALSPFIAALFFPATQEVAVDFEEEPALGSYIRIGLLFVTGAVGLMRYMKARSMGQRKLPIQLILLGLFLVLALVSTSYSIEKQYTFVRSASFIALFGFLLGLYSWIDSEQRLNQALYALVAMVCFLTVANVVALAAFPERAWYGNRFQGLSSHPNTMGNLCMLAYPLLFWAYGRCTRPKRCALAALLLTLFALHVLTGSRGSLLAAICGLGAWSIVQGKPARFIVLLGAAAMGGLIMFQVTPDSFEREGGHDATDLSGRPEFWYGSLVLIREKPLLGYGYAVEGGVWNDPRFNQPEYSLWRGTARSSLHNGYLSVAVGLGLAALLAWCAILIIPLWRFRLAPYSDYKGLAMAVIVASLLLNGVETEIGGMATVFWIVWVIAGRVSEARHLGPELSADFVTAPQAA